MVKCHQPISPPTTILTIEFMSVLKYLIAFSGGLDSTVLLHDFWRQCTQAGDQHQLRAIHVHHGLQAEANTWVTHCQSICHTWGIPLTVVHIDGQAQAGESPEAAARLARYQALYASMNDHTVLVTGHHQNDQAETILLQLLRGAGAKGLSAMPVWKKLKHGWHYRPLLAYSRQHLLQRAQEWQLSWIEDPSNQHCHYARNALRHQIFPVLQRIWPGATKALSRSCQLLAQDQALLQQWASEQLQGWQTQPQTLPLAKLLSLNKAHQALLVRTWLAQQGHPMPNEAQLTQFLSDVARARHDRHPQLSWANRCLYRHQQQLRWRYQSCTAAPIAWLNFPEAIRINPLLHLQAVKQLGGLRPLTALEIQRLSIRMERPTGRFHPAGRHHSQSIKKLLQEWHIPMELRQDLICVYCGECLIAISHYGVAKDWYTPDEGFAIKPSQP